MSARGRLPAADQSKRRGAILAAALAELRERGFERATMLGIARRSGASKETLYSWFTNKEGLFSALIQEQAEQTNRAVERALDTDEPANVVLTTIAQRLLRLLTGANSIAINRAAMASPELATLLLKHGRFETGGLIAEYLGKLASMKSLKNFDQEESFQVFYGLVIQDWQIRALLGDSPLSDAEIDRNAEQAVARFLQLIPLG